MIRNLISAIAWAGIIAGTLDIMAACGLFSIRTGQDPIIVLKFVASGALGSEALKGEWPTALFGLLIHYLIAFIWTTLYFLGYSKIKQGHWIVNGLIYGGIVWILMNLVVLPYLSRITLRPLNLSGVLTGVIVLMIAIGLPVSYLANKYYKN